MSCPSCSGNSNISFTITPTACTCGCTPCSCTTVCDACNTSTTTDSTKILYSGAALTCLDLPTGTNLEDIIQAIDSTICTTLGTDYSTYNKACLLNSDTSQITTEAQFVTAISAYVCNFKTTYNTFVTNYNTFVTNITNLVGTASVPGITSACSGIANTDTNAQALTKVETSICSIKTAINPSGANWNSCGFSVGTAPTTIVAGFNKILSYLCTVQAAIPDAVTLPTFDNTGSCLGGTLTTTDTLVSTIGKIKTRLCMIPVVDYTALNYGCVDGATTLVDALQNTIDRVNSFQIYTWDSTYFTLSNIDGTYPCLGKHVTINPSGLDKKVASNSADGSPGYLDAKMQAGTGVSLDFTGTPGKVVITNSSPADSKVKVNSSDASADYLDTKIDGTSDTTGSLTLAATTNGGNSKVIITPTFDLSILAGEILTTIAGNTALYAQLCQMNCGCNCTGNTAQMYILNTTESSNRLFQITFVQNTPTLSWFNSAATVLGGGSNISTGTYAITTAVTNPLTTIAIKNNDSSAMTAHVYVRDLANNAVTSSSSFTQTISAGSTYTDASFALGLGTTGFVVHVDLS